MLPELRLCACIVLPLVCELVCVSVHIIVLNCLFDYCPCIPSLDIHTRARVDVLWSRRCSRNKSVQLECIGVVPDVKNKILNVPPRLHSRG